MRREGLEKCWVPVGWVVLIAESEPSDIVFLVIFLVLLLSIVISHH